MVGREQQTAHTKSTERATAKGMCISTDYKCAPLSSASDDTHREGSKCRSICTKTLLKYSNLLCENAKSATKSKLPNKFGLVILMGGRTHT